MTFWKPHALARPAKDQLEIGAKSKVLGFKVANKVVAVRELPGVPAGTIGKIILSNGFNWMRYRVYFSNGVELNDLDGKDIASAKSR